MLENKSDLRSFLKRVVCLEKSDVKARIIG